MSPTKKKRMKKRERKKKVMIDIRRQSKFVRRSARQPQTSKDFLLVESRNCPTRGSGCFSFFIAFMLCPGFLFYGGKGDSYRIY